MPVRMHSIDHMRCPCLIGHAVNCWGQSLQCSCITAANESLHCFLQPAPHLCVVFAALSALLSCHSMSCQIRGLAWPAVLLTSVAQSARSAAPPLVALQRCAALPCSALLRAALPCPALPCPALLCSALLPVALKCRVCIPLRFTVLLCSSFHRFHSFYSRPFLNRTALLPCTALHGIALQRHRTDVECSSLDK